MQNATEFLISYFTRAFTREPTTLRLVVAHLSPRRTAGDVKITVTRRTHSELEGPLDDERPRQRRRTFTPAQRAFICSTIVAAVIVPMVDRVHHAPQVWASVYVPKRLERQEHVNDPKARNLFRRYYRMSEPAFNKLAYLLSPHLQKNEEFASE